MTDEERAKIFTIKLLNITEEKFDLVMLNYNNELLEENVIMYVYNSHLAGLTEGRKERNCVNCSNHGKQFEVMKLEKEKADLQQRLDWAQGFLDKDVEYDEFNRLQKENAELKEYIKKYNKNNMLCFAADMVYKALNPKSTMCTPNCVYIKMESELENWSK